MRSLRNSTRSRAGRALRRRALHGAVSAALAAAFVGAPVSMGSAASVPSGPGSGLKRGLEQVNTSGQVGEITLFASGSTTRVAVGIVGANGRTETDGIFRGSTCASVVRGSAAYGLKKLNRAGFSHSLLHASEANLLSGQFSVYVFAAGTGRHRRPVACGHLYH